MLFRAENLGPLREAEVDLSKDLIVLTGPNNSGKTYLAWSVYGLYRAQAEAREPELYPLWLADKLLATPEQRIKFKDIETGWGRFLSSVADACARDLYRCFAAGSEQFAEVRLSIRMDDPGKLTKRFRSPPYRSRGAVGLIHLTVDRTRKEIAVRLYRRKRKVDDKSEPAGDKAELFAEVAWRDMVEMARVSARNTVARILFRIMRQAAFRHCVLFPAERIAVNIFARELELKRTELVEEIADEKFDEEAVVEEVKQRVGRYPWPIRDSLRVANDLSYIAKETTEFADLASELESALLHGKVGVSEYGEMVFTPDAAPTKRLSVHLTASVVKSLASLVFYFRHMASRGDFLIIDEPELNLHPDNQRKIARILAKAVNRGFKIMMSTHSDYIIRELNNLIMLNQKSEAAEGLINEFGYDRASLLDPAKIGVYLFNEQRSQAVEVTEAGFEVKTIEDEINQLNLVSQRIYGTLFD